MNEPNTPADGTPPDIQKPPPEIILQALDVANQTDETPLREGQLREPGLILGYVRAMRRRKATPEEREAETFVKHALRRAYAEWHAKQPKRKPKVRKERVRVRR